MRRRYEQYIQVLILKELQYIHTFRPYLPQTCARVPSTTENNCDCQLSCVTFLKVSIVTGGQDGDYRELVSLTLHALGQVGSVQQRLAVRPDPSLLLPQAHSNHG